MSGMPLPISIGEVRNYADYFYLYDLQEREDLLDYIRALDGDYLKFLESKRKKETHGRSRTPRHNNPVAARSPRTRRG